MASPTRPSYPPTMDEEAAFRQKWQSRIDGCGPYCSCLVIIIVLVLAFFGFVLR